MPKYFQKTYVLITFVYFQECDIRDENQVAAAFKWIEEVCGGVDLWVIKTCSYNLFSLKDAVIIEWLASNRFTYFVSLILNSDS